MGLIDRLQYAQSLSEGKRVLDVGGLGMTYQASNSSVMGRILKVGHHLADALGRGRRVTATDSSFANALGGPGQVASEYRVVDYTEHPKVHYAINMNEKDSVQKMRDALEEFKPEVILCMETLEHVNYHFEIMNAFADAASKYGTVVFITLPNNANWVLNALGWNFDHSVAFFRDIAERFVTRSDLGKHEVTYGGCMQKYVWHWWIVYLASFCQPFNLGFTIRPKAEASLP
jgi:hypothetical protein